MKISNIFTSVLVAVAALIGMSSCSDDGYWTEYVPEGVQYSFVRSEIKDEFTLSVDVAEEPVTIKLRRSEKNGSVTLPLEAKEVSKEAFKYFTIPTEVTFEDGSYEAEVTVYFLKSLHKVHRKISLEFDKSLVSPSGTYLLNIDCMWVKP